MGPNGPGSPVRAAGTRGARTTEESSCSSRSLQTSASLSCGKVGVNDCLLAFIESWKSAACVCVCVSKTVGRRSQEVQRLLSTTNHRPRRSHTDLGARGVGAGVSQVCTWGSFLPEPTWQGPVLSSQTWLDVFSFSLNSSFPFHLRGQ